MKIILDGLDLEEELQEYVLDLEEAGKSPNTIKNYTIWIMSFINYVKNSLEESGAKVKSRDKIIEITRVKLTVTRYQKYLQNLKQKNTTINLKIIALNSFFNYLHITEKDKRGRDVSVKIPTLEIHYKHSIEDNRLMELTDFFKLIEVAKEKGDLRAVALFYFLFNTGARISEALSVNIEMVEKAGTSYVASIIGKRGKTRVIDFNEETYKALEEYLYFTGRGFNFESNSNNTGAIFITEKKFIDGYHRLTPKMADWSVKKYAEMTGLPRTKFFSHNFRHLIAKTLLDEGTSLDKVKNFLGHTNISTTAIYTMGKASELREVKSSAIKNAKIKVIASKYDSIYKPIVEAIGEEIKISDAKLAELIGVSKATFSRNHKEVAQKIRRELKV